MASIIPVIGELTRVARSLEDAAIRLRHVAESPVTSIRC